MGERGPIPEPLALKILKGTAREQKVGDAAIVSSTFRPLKESPAPPSHLNRQAREAWSRIAAILVEESALTQADLPLLEIYSCTFAAWQEAVEDVQRRGTTIVLSHGRMAKGKKSTVKTVRANPSAALALKYVAALGEIGERMRLSAASRARLPVVEQKSETPEEAAAKRLLG